MNPHDVDTILSEWRLSVRSVVHKHNCEGKGIFAMVYVGEGEGRPSAWLEALQGPDFAKMPQLEMAQRKGTLRLLLIEDSWAKRLPRPEDHGCSTELRGYDEVGLVTLVRLAAPLASVA